MIRKETIKFDGVDYDAVRIMDSTHSWLIAEASLNGKLIDEWGYTSDEAERIDLEVCYFTDAIKSYECEADLLNRLIEEDPDYFNIEFNKNVVRRCSVCGEVMQMGYMDNWNEWHACSDKCCDKYYREHYGDSAKEQRMEDYANDQCMLVEWESPFYDDVPSYYR